MDPVLSVLLAEDDTELCSLMRDFFAPHGLRMEAVHNGREAARRALEDEFDLVILDVMLPGLDGFEVLRQIRLRSAIPVIMLTARTSRTDRVDGLNSGADDYLPKPFAPDELLARIRAVLAGRRQQRDERDLRVWRAQNKAGHARGVAQQSAGVSDFYRIRYPAVPGQSRG
jgi:DNA-binding response OmpR family regulator